jgi:hypothetical protein
MGSPGKVVTLAANVRASVLYNGGANADKRLAMNTTTSGALISNAEVISVGNNDLLDVFIQNVTGAETLTLDVIEYSAEVPALANVVRQQEISTGSDLTRLVDRANVGLTTGTNHYAKAPCRVNVLPGSFVVLCIKENATGPIYAHYSLQTP